MTSWRRLIALLCFAVASALVLASLALGVGLQNPDSNAIGAEYRQAKAELGARLHALRLVHQAADLPPSSVAALGAALAHDPLVAHAYLINEFEYEPYAGVMRGANGTLAARSGNSLDLSLLLQGLLEGADPPLEMRFAMAELSSEQASALVAETAIRSTGGNASLVEAAAETMFAGRQAIGEHDPLELAGGELRAVLQDARASAGQFVAIRDSVVLDGIRRAQQAAIESARHHVWLQVRIGDRWKSFDPASDLPLPDSGIRFYDALPSELEHTVAVRVEVERLEGSEITRELVAEQKWALVDLDGRALELLISPPELIAEDPFVSAANQKPLVERLDAFDSFEVSVGVTDEPASQGMSFGIDGRVSASYSGGGGFGFGPVDPFGRLPSATAVESQLAGLWLSFTLSGPDGTPETETRALLDRIGAAARSRGEFVIAPAWQDLDRVRLALIQRQRALLPVGPLGTTRVAEDALAALLHGGALERALDLDFGAYSGTLVEALDGLLLPTLPTVLVAVSDHSLTFAESAAGGMSRVFLAEPNLYLWSETLELGEGGDISARNGIDLVRNRVRVIGDARASSEARLLHGLLASELEGRMLQASDPEAEVMWAAEVLRLAGEQGIELRTITSLPELANVGTDDDSRALMASSLDSGSILLVPAVPASVENGKETVAWWEMDLDGHVLAVGEGGRGQAATEGVLVLKHISVPMVERSMTFVACFNKAIGGGGSMSAAGGECMAQVIRDHVKHTLDGAIKQFAGDLFKEIDPVNAEVFEEYKKLYDKAKKAYKDYQTAISSPLELLPHGGEVGDAVRKGQEAAAAGGEIGSLFGFRIYLLLTMGSDITDFATKL